jgi:hypothetical protein
MNSFAEKVQLKSLNRIGDDYEMTTLLSIAYIVFVSYVAVEYMACKSGVDGDISEDLKGEFK